MWESTTPTWLPVPNSRPSSRTPSVDSNETAWESASAAARSCSPRLQATSGMRNERRSRPARRDALAEVPLATLLPALPARLLEQLLMLLLAHLLAALLDQRRHRRPFILVELLRSEQVPEIHPLGAIGLLQANGAKSKRPRPRCHGGDQAEDILLGDVLEITEPRRGPRPVREPHEDPVQHGEVEQRGERRHEDRGFHPEPVELAAEVAGHGALTVLGAALHAGRHDVGDETERDDLGGEEPLDHAEERQELLAALQPDDEVGLQELDLVVLQDLPVDPGDQPARVDNHEVGSLLPGLPVELGDAGDDGQEMALGGGRTDERQRIGPLEHLGGEVIGRADVLQRDRGRWSDRFLADVGVQERGRSSRRHRGLEQPPCEGALARVDPADQHHGSLRADRLVDQRFVLVHIASAGPSQPTTPLGGPSVRAGQPTPAVPPARAVLPSSFARRLRNALRPRPRDRTVPSRRVRFLPSGPSYRGSGHASRDHLEAGPVVLGPNVVVHHDHDIGTTLRPRHDERRIVHVGDRDRLDAAFDRGAGEAVIGQHEVGADLLQHPDHRPIAVRVPHRLAVGRHRHALEVPDLATVPVVAGLGVPGALERLEDLDATGAQEPTDLDVQVREPDRMAGGDDHALAAPDGLGQPVPGGLARVEDEVGVDRHGPFEPGRVGIEPRGLRDELEHLARRERLEPGHPERLVRIALGEAVDVPADVVHRMAHPGTGDAAGQEPGVELVSSERMGRPSLVEARQPRRVASGNVHRHPSYGEGLAMDARALEGQVAIVSGAGRGIGRAIALAFARAGAAVTLASRTESELEAVAAEVEDLGQRALVVPTDVADEGAVDRLVERTATELGTLDVMVNNAGAAPFLAPFMETRPEGFAKYFGVNFWSVVFGTRAAGRVLLEKGSGCVLNLASIDAFMIDPDLSYYGAAKAAVVNLTKAVALEWAPSGVRVNALAPGWIDTPMNQPERDDPEAERRILAQIPMGRWGRAEEIAQAALFLCSPAASFITGEVLVADGGQTITSGRA